MGETIVLNLDPAIAERIAAKTTSAKEALSHIRSGDRVFVGSVCATPQLLAKTLEETGAAKYPMKCSNTLCRLFRKPVTPQNRG
jgi:acyl-CoA hydrolase